MISNIDDQELDKLISRVEFYEACTDQLKKEIPRYLNKQFELEKSHKSMAKSLRSVASTEPNQKLQNLIFLFAQKHELLEKNSLVFNDCENKSIVLLEDCKKMLIAPIKEVIVDQKNIRKINLVNKVHKNDITDNQFIKATLPIHAKMFEKHRVQNQLKLFRTLIESELKYHCKAIEELSIVLRELSLIEE